MSDAGASPPPPERGRSASEARRVGVALPRFNPTRQQSRDERRTTWLKGCGVTELRFWNNDVAQNLIGVLELIKATADKLRANGKTPTRRWRADLPLSGGGE